MVVRASGWAPQPKKHCPVATWPSEQTRAMAGFLQPQSGELEGVFLFGSECAISSFPGPQNMVLLVKSLQQHETGFKEP